MDLHPRMEIPNCAPLLSPKSVILHMALASIPSMQPCVDAVGNTPLPFLLFPTCSQAQKDVTLGSPLQPVTPRPLESRGPQDIVHKIAAFRGSAGRYLEAAIGEACPLALWAHWIPTVQLNAPHKGCHIRHTITEWNPAIPRRDVEPNLNPPPCRKRHKRLFLMVKFSEIRNSIF